MADELVRKGKSRGNPLVDVAAQMLSDGGKTGLLLALGAEPQLRGVVNPILGDILPFWAVGGGAMLRRGSEVLSRIFAGAAAEAGAVDHAPVLRAIALRETPLAEMASAVQLIPEAETGLAATEARARVRQRFELERFREQVPADFFDGPKKGSQLVAFSQSLRSGNEAHGPEALLKLAATVAAVVGIAKGGGQPPTTADGFKAAEAAVLQGAADAGRAAADSGGVLPLQEKAGAAADFRRKLAAEKSAFLGDFRAAGDDAAAKAAAAAGHLRRVGEAQVALAAAGDPADVFAVLRASTVASAVHGGEGGVPLQQRGVVDTRPPFGSQDAQAAAACLPFTCGVFRKRPPAFTRAEKPLDELQLEGRLAELMKKQHRLEGHILLVSKRLRQNLLDEDLPQLQGELETLRKELDDLAEDAAPDELDYGVHAELFDAVWEASEALIEGERLESTLETDVRGLEAQLRSKGVELPAEGSQGPGGDAGELLEHLGYLGGAYEEGMQREEELRQQLHLQALMRLGGGGAPVAADAAAASFGAPLSGFAEHEAALTISLKNRRPEERAVVTRPGAPRGQEGILTASEVEARVRASDALALGSGYNGAARSDGSKLRTTPEAALADGVPVLLAGLALHDVGACMEAEDGVFKPPAGTHAGDIVCAPGVPTAVDPRKPAAQQLVRLLMAGPQYILQSRAKVIRPDGREAKDAAKRTRRAAFSGALCPPAGAAPPDAAVAGGRHRPGLGRAGSAMGQLKGSFFDFSAALLLGATSAPEETAALAQEAERLMGSDADGPVLSAADEAILKQLRSSFRRPKAWLLVQIARASTAAQTVESSLKRSRAAFKAAEQQVPEGEPLIALRVEGHAVSGLKASERQRWVAGEAICSDDAAEGLAGAATDLVLRLLAGDATLETGALLPPWGLRRRPGG